MTMRAGLLDTEVRLFDITHTDDGAGGSTLSSTEHAESPVWAWVRAANWKQVEAARRLEQRISHAVTIRWQEDLASFGPDARLTFVDRAGRTRALSIKTVVDPEEDGRWLELGCVEGGPQ